MRSLGWFLGGAIALLAAILIGGGVVVMRAHGFSARDQPSAPERWIARRARSSAAIPAGARDEANPVGNSPEVLAEARAHWADHCAVCHANDGSGDTEMGKDLYPPAPDMRAAETQSLSDGELFFIIQNGVRLTGMPAWGNVSTHDSDASWKLVRFIRHLPKLTAEELTEMQKLNPKSPDELKEEREEREFLNGDHSHEHD